MPFPRPQVYAIRSFPEGTVRGYGVRVTFNYLVGLMADAEKVAA